MFANFAFQSSRWKGEAHEVKVEHDDKKRSLAKISKGGSVEIDGIGVGKNQKKKKRLQISEEKVKCDMHDKRVVQYEMIVELRKHVKHTPVDLFGTQNLMDSTMSEKAQRFHVLIASLLSSQTKDQVTAQAMGRLHALEEKLCIDTILQINEKELAQLLIPVGFYRKKAEAIKKIARILRDSFDDDIPDTLADLESLPLVGPKIARLIMLVGREKTDGIIVDTHVHRISQRLHWVGELKQPESTRRELEEWLPPSLWSDFSRVIIGFGQEICLPRRPKCNICPLRLECPSTTLQ